MFFGGRLVWLLVGLKGLVGLIGFAYLVGLVGLVCLFACLVGWLELVGWLVALGWLGLGLGCVLFGDFENLVICFTKFHVVQKQPRG